MGNGFPATQGFRTGKSSIDGCIVLPASLAGDMKRLEDYRHPAEERSPAEIRASRIVSGNAGLAAN